MCAQIANGQRKTYFNVEEPAEKVNFSILSNTKLLNINAIKTLTTDKYIFQISKVYLWFNAVF